MVFRKTILQVYSGKEPFSFHDFVRGTLRLINYAIDRNIDIKINIAGSEFEPYLIVNNTPFDSVNIIPQIYYTNIDQDLLIKNLDAFMVIPDALLVITSNVWIDRSDIYNESYLRYHKLVRYSEQLYTAANNKVLANLLYRPHSDNLMYGYNIIYISSDDFKSTITARNLATVANQIRTSLDMNKDYMVFSNSIQLRTILSQYIEMNSAAVQKIDESDINIGVVASFPSVQDIMIDFIILMKARKIYRFSDTMLYNGHNIKYNIARAPITSIYDTASDINNIIGNLDITVVPLYYMTYTFVGCSTPTPPSRLQTQTKVIFDNSGNPRSQISIPQPGVKLDSSGNYISALNNPSGLALDSSGNIFIADTANHRICKLDTLGNLTTYAGSSTGVSGYLDTGAGAASARFNMPTAIAIDKQGNIYVADTGNNAIRIIEKHFTIDSSGNEINLKNKIVATLVGQGSTLVSSGTGSANTLNGPRGIAVDSVGSVYISDTGNNRICKITGGGNLITLAGSTITDGGLSYLSGYLNGEGTNASFNSPTGLTVDLIGNIYVADTGNNVIRRVTQAGKVTTVAGNAQPFFKEGRRDRAGFKGPTGIVVDLNNTLYVSDTGNNMIRRITTDGDVIPIVGAPDQKSGAIDGYGACDPVRGLVPFNKRASFYGPSALIIDPLKKLYIADTLNNTIRRIDTTFSSPTKIKPVSMQTIKLIRGPGVGLTLGPTLTAPQPPPNTIMYGQRRGR